MHKYLMTVFCVLGLSLTFAFSQTRDNQELVDVRDYIPTENLDWKDANTFQNRPKRKKIEVLYKPDAYGILYGNPCAIDATRQMGFIYIVQVDGLPGSSRRIERIVNNFLVNLKLIFTRSPFWKLILDKRIKECRERSGDFVG